VKNGSTKRASIAAISERTRMNQVEKSKQIQQIIAKCWSDESFKQKVLADPTAILKAEGVSLPEGVSVATLENTDKVLYLVIPAKPTELSDEDLDKVAGGDVDSCSGWF